MRKNFFEFIGRKFFQQKANASRRARKYLEDFQESAKSIKDEDFSPLSTIAGDEYPPIDTEHSQEIAQKHTGNLSTQLVASYLLKDWMAYMRSSHVAKSYSSKVTYDTAKANWKGMSATYRKTQGQNLFLTRTQTVLGPMALVNSFAELFGLSDFDRAVAASTIETFVTSVTREASARFSALNAHGVDVLNKEGNIIDLTKIKEQKEFFRYKGEVLTPVKLEPKELESLYKMADVFGRNYLTQLSTLHLRNFAFCFGVFMSEPLAKDIVKNSLSHLSPENQKYAEKFCDYSLRAGFALITTFFDRSLTLASSGRLEPGQIYDKLKNELSGAEGRKLFAGGAGRMKYVMASMFTLIEAPAIGRMLYKNLEEITDGWMDEAIDFAAKKIEKAPEKFDQLRQKLGKGFNDFVKGESTIADIFNPRPKKQDSPQAVVIPTDKEKVVESRSSQKTK